MNPEWYFKVGGQVFGPVTSAELREKAGSGELLPTHQIRKESMNDWRQASLVKGLFADPIELDISHGATKQLPPSLGIESRGNLAEKPDSKESRLPQSAEQLTNTVKSVFGSLKGAVGGTVSKIQAATVANSNTTEVVKSSEELPIRLPANIGEQDVLFRCQGTYRGGHPAHLEMAVKKGTRVAAKTAPTRMAGRWR